MGIFNFIKSLFSGKSEDEIENSLGDQNQKGSGGAPLSPHDQTLPHNNDAQIEKKAVEQNQQQLQNNQAAPSTQQPVQHTQQSEEQNSASVQQNTPQPAATNPAQTQEQQSVSTQSAPQAPSEGAAPPVTEVPDHTSSVSSDAAPTQGATNQAPSVATAKSPSDVHGSAGMTGDTVGTVKDSKQDNGSNTNSESN
ncbi:MAG: hypothetical protein RLN62_03610 [Rickettsiales bacterium]